MASNEDKLKIIDSVMNNLSVIAEKKRELNLGNNEIRDLFTALVQSSVDIIDNKTPALSAPKETVIEGTATAVNSTVGKKEKEELPPGHPDYYANQYRKIGSILRGLGIIDKAEKSAKSSMFSFYNSAWEYLKGNIPQQMEFCRAYAKEILEANEEFNQAKKSGIDLVNFAANKLNIIQEKHKAAFNKSSRYTKPSEEVSIYLSKNASEPPSPSNAALAAAAERMKVKLEAVTKTIAAAAAAEPVAEPVAAPVAVAEPVEAPAAEPATKKAATKKAVEPAEGTPEA